MDQIGHRYGCRPSTLLDVRDPVVAFDVDQMAWTFGQWFDGKRQETVRVKPRKSDGKVEAPRYSATELRRMLGLIESTEITLTIADVDRIEADLLAFDEAGEWA